MTTAFWRTLYAAGCDVARLTETPGGRRLAGTAIWVQDDRPSRLDYAVELNRDWSTRRGMVSGFVGDAAVDHVIVREAGRWSLDGQTLPELDDLVDLDLAFTPATNMQQLRRAGLEIGEQAEIPAAWLDFEGRLSRLPQTYCRTGEESYAYEAPTAGYAATLIVAPDGFVREYPTLWTRVS